MKVRFYSTEAKTYLDKFKGKKGFEALETDLKELEGIRALVEVQVKEEGLEFDVHLPNLGELIKQRAKEGNLSLEECIKLVKLKEKSLLGKDLKAKLAQVIGTCGSAGIKVEGKPAKEMLKELKELSNDRIKGFKLDDRTDKANQS